MVKIIGVRFRNISKVYYFDPKDLAVKAGDHVIVETSRGVEYGKVVFEPRLVPDEKIVHPLRQVCRMADLEDDQRVEENIRKEKEAYQICVRKIREHDLEMKLIDVEFTFDNSKILFYFTADGRIDFRILVKDLASIFKTRIELRQIGVRDEAKILGGIGICGRALCCHSYLTDFVPVSIRMAKEQNLSLNQTKISGVCGRLMCCLKNEQETYEELNKKLPGIGDTVAFPDGTEGKVHSINVLRQTVKVTVEIDDEKELVECPVEEISFQSKKKKNKDPEPEPKENPEKLEILIDDPEEEQPKKEKKENTVVSRRDRKNKKGAKSQEKEREEPADKADKPNSQKGSRPQQGKNHAKPGEEGSRNRTRRKSRNSSEKKELPKHEGTGAAKRE